MPVAAFNGSLDGFLSFHSNFTKPTELFCHDDVASDSHSSINGELQLVRFFIFVLQTCKDRLYMVPDWSYWLNVAKQISQLILEAQFFACAYDRRLSVASCKSRLCLAVLVTSWHTQVYYSAVYNVNLANAAMPANGLCSLQVQLSTQQQA